MHRTAAAETQRIGTRLIPVARQKISLKKLLPELTRLENDADLRKFLSRHPMLVRPKAVEQLAPLVVDTIRLDALGAFRLAQTPVLTARKHRCREGVALALRAHAN